MHKFTVGFLWEIHGLPMDFSIEKKIPYHRLGNKGLGIILCFILLLARLIPALPVFQLVRRFYLYWHQ